MPFTGKPSKFLGQTGKSISYGSPLDQGAVSLQLGKRLASQFGTDSCLKFKSLRCSSLNPSADGAAGRPHAGRFLFSLDATQENRRDQLSVWALFFQPESLR
jgi:hypothetical protein